MPPGLEPKPEITRPSMGQRNELREGGSGTSPKAARRRGGGRAGIGVALASRTAGSAEEAGDAGDTGGSSTARSPAPPAGDTVPRDGERATGAAVGNSSSGAM